MIIEMTTMRTYGDGCSSAHALDLVGERWALLIVRDLLFGPKRFSDLTAGLPQGSPNVLTQRLRELEAAGIVRRRKLPPPASTMVYELTEWGAELEPILMGLQRWGAASPTFPHDVPVGCDAAMLALKNGFDAGAGADVDAVVEIRFGAGTFAVTVGDGQLDIRRGAADHPSAVIVTEPVTLEEVAFGMRTLDSAESAGDLVVEGDHALAERFFSMFPVGQDQVAG
jgi:DNA-binding HxlR family transcriptional regulator